MESGSCGEPEQTELAPGKAEEFSEGPCHAQGILQVLNGYRQSGTFTDVVLQAGGSEFPCHRATLSASCLYFRAMFNGKPGESRPRVVHIEGVAARALEAVLHFAYEGAVALDEENVGSVFHAADLLGVSALSEACVGFLEERVDHSNCLGIMDFARSYVLAPLASQCETMLYRDFVEVYKQEEFLSQDKERVVELLTSDQLQVESEEVLVEAVLKWVHHRPGERSAALRELLELVRLPLVDPVFLVTAVESDELVLDCKECRPLLLEARRFHALGREVDSARTRPRRTLGRAEMIVVIGGCDRNGFARLSFTEKLNPYTREWLPAATIPGYSKSEFATCELQNDVYVSGGQLNSSDVWRYMPQLDHWVRVAALAKGRWRHKMAALQGKLYVVGGFNGMERLCSVEVYSVYHNQWRTVAPLPLPVSSAAVVGCAGKLYVIGGAVSNDCNTNKVQCYDPRSDQWVCVGTCPFSQRCISAVTHNGAIYLAGGLLDHIYCYCPQTHAWSREADLPMKLESCGLTVCEGKVYVVGGRDESSVATERVWALCPQSGTLTEEAPMSRSVSYHGCVTITQRLPNTNTS